MKEFKNYQLQQLKKCLIYQDKELNLHVNVRFYRKKHF